MSQAQSPDLGRCGLAEKYKNADKQRCPPGLRRKSGVSHLGSSDGSENVCVQRKSDASMPPTPSSPELSPVRSLLAPLEALQLDRRADHVRRKGKRATWESSLPINFESHSNHVTPGHTLEYINQGVPAPRKKMEDFNVSTKIKRRNSSQ